MALCSLYDLWFDLDMICSALNVIWIIRQLCTNNVESCQQAILLLLATTCMEAKNAGKPGPSICMVIFFQWACIVNIYWLVHIAHETLNHTESRLTVTDKQFSIITIINCKLQNEQLLSINLIQGGLR